MNYIILCTSVHHIKLLNRMEEEVWKNFALEFKSSHNTDNFPFLQKVTLVKINKLQK